MHYKYDEKTLSFIKVNKLKLSLKWLSIVGIFFFVFGFSVKVSSKIETIPESEVKLIVLKEQQFTKEKLVESIKSLNFKFPHIVYAQAIHETNNFKSNIFIENNNLFGMKEAVVRINTAKGTQYDHAFYDNWKESLYDYALYSSRYLSSITSEAEYLQYLNTNYAADVEYVSKLNDIIQRENLKEFFN
jgi:flagellum-specific peptidoglycan hydrolase FlgJ